MIVQEAATDAAPDRDTMDRLMALVAAHGYRAVESEARGWATTLDAETRRTVELALAADGVDGIGDLMLAGPALGGLDEAQVAGMVATVEVALGALLAA